MQQVLFHIPFTSQWFPPDGLPLYGFGAMLFLTFLLTAMVWGPRRVVKVGMPKEKLQDMAIILFLTGIAGARLVYMWQYYNQFPDKSFQGLAAAFFSIWDGGIVFYGSIFGGVLGYIVFYRLVLRKYNVSTWKLADAIAPLIALGLAIGRIGCYLNGCCWGQVACAECQEVPLAPELGQFPLLTAHARDQVCRPAKSDDRMPWIRGLQTPTGFSIQPSLGFGVGDPRSVIQTIEPGSSAEAAGLQPEDRIIGVDGQPNRILIDLFGEPNAISKLKAMAGEIAGTSVLNVEKSEGSQARIQIDDPKVYQEVAQKLRLSEPRVSMTVHDSLWFVVADPPRGKQKLILQVERNGEAQVITYTPLTVTFFPTQLYETISMFLLIALLLAFQPFRRHHGQLIVLLMLGYAAHRFMNEAIRIEPTYQFDLTLSQLISIGIALAALALELFLRTTQPKLKPGLQPLGAD